MVSDYNNNISGLALLIVPLRFWKDWLDSHYVRCESGPQSGNEAASAPRCLYKRKTRQGQMTMHVLYSLAYSLCQAVFNFSALSQEGVNAVHIVCRNGNASGFRTLIIKGADTSCRDMVSAIVFIVLSMPPCKPVSLQMGRIPLHYGAASGNVELVSLLLKWHSDPSATDKVRRYLPLLRANAAGLWWWWWRLC